MKILLSLIFLLLHTPIFAEIFEESPENGDFRYLRDIKFVSFKEKKR